MSIEIRQARDSEIDEIAGLVNRAYRGESSKAGWATEAELVGGQRTDPGTLRSGLSDSAVILTLRLNPGGPIEGCVLLKKQPRETCYLGLLTVNPTAQAHGLGRTLLEHSENFARDWGATRMVMTVIPLRDKLVAWYERRGYSATGETEPFPYGDARFGEPKVEGLYFIVLGKQL